MDTKKIKLNIYLLRRIVIAVYCIVIGVSVYFVMAHIYDPKINSVNALASVFMDIICIIILLILICSITFDYHGSDRTTKLFAVLLIASVWATFLDFLNWSFDGYLEFWDLTYWFTVGSLCMGSVLAGMFLLYLHSYMADTHNLEHLRIQAAVCVVLNVISFICSFGLAITGTAFEYIDGHYKTGALYDVVTVIPILTLLFFTGFVIFNVKKIGVHDVLAVAGYIIFMVAGALIEAAHSIGTTYVAVVIADIFIFVMIQNQVISNEKRNVKKWMSRSNTDPLTELLNRRAYESEIDRLKNEELDNNFVFISIDVNSLKVVNDTYGHMAGDELLRGAASCIKECFGPYGKLYRIGGDEFIALINASPDVLDNIKKDIEETTSAWNGKIVHNLSLSCGFVSKCEEEDLTIHQMANIADHRMYEAKREYYRKSDNERRKE